jgi:hypothetical protein
MMLVMTSTERSEFAARDLISVAEFRGWLARAAPGAALEYHRGLLILDRSPASELSEDERRVVARLADAAFQAAEEGRVHLVQRRNGEFDFSYLAVKAAPARGKRAGRSLPDAGADDLPAAA